MDCNCKAVGGTLCANESPSGAHCEVASFWPRSISAESNKSKENFEQARERSSSLPSEVARRPGAWLFSARWLPRWHTSGDFARCNDCECLMPKSLAKPHLTACAKRCSASALAQESRSHTRSRFARGSAQQGYAADTGAQGSYIKLYLRITTRRSAYPQGAIGQKNVVEHNAGKMNKEKHGDSTKYH